MIADIWVKCISQKVQWSIASYLGKTSGFKMAGKGYEETNNRLNLHGIKKSDPECVLKV